MNAMLLNNYFTRVLECLEQVRDTQSNNLQRAAELIAQTVVDKHRTYLFGSGHSNLLVAENCLRAGELAIYNPIYVAGLLPTDYPYLRGGLLERLSGIASAALRTVPANAGDTLIVISNSGRNSVPVEMAMEARSLGMHVIALTSVQFSKQVTSRHSSGKKLYELAEVVLDNCGPVGDAVVNAPHIPASIGPVSTILGSYILHGLSCKVAELLLEQGIIPPIFISGNVDGGEAYGKALIDSSRELISYA